MKISLKALSDSKILKSSNGEVTTVGLYDGRRRRPCMKGLLCETIFGPYRDYCCTCGQLKGLKNANKVCKTCHVTCGPASLRDELWGHIDLGTHIISPTSRNILVKLLGLSDRHLLAVLRAEMNLMLMSRTEAEAGRSHSRDLIDIHGNTMVITMFDRDEDEDIDETTGTLALFNALAKIDSSATMEHLAKNHPTRNVLRHASDPEFSILDLMNRYWAVPPASMRPASISDRNQVDSECNELYRRILRHSGSLRQARDVANTDEELAKLPLIESHFGILMCKAVASLTKDGAKVKQFGRMKRLASIMDGLGDKGGRLRGNILGKRVDFSGRSVIITDPELKIDEIGVPEPMVFELLRPFIIGKLIKTEVDLETGESIPYNVAFRLWNSRSTKAKHAMDQIIESGECHRFLSNRAPSLHRNSVQGLKVVPTAGKALRISPHSCAPQNADHDGDAESVHVTLSKEANEEVIELVGPENNLLMSRDGSPTYSLSHEQIVGVYYLTHIPESHTNRRFMGSDINQVITEWEAARILDPDMQVQATAYVSGGVRSTIGRLMVDDCLGNPAGTCDGPMSKDEINAAIVSLYDERRDGPEILNRIRDLGMLGYVWSTRMGLSVAMDHFSAPSTREGLIEEGEEFELKDESPNKEQSVRNWARITSQLEQDYLSEQPEENPLKFMFQTKARVSMNQLRQMCIFKGQIATPSGGIVLIKQSLKDGVGPVPYMWTCSGTRQSLGANHEIVPQSGYLTRQLVSAARDLYVKSDSLDTEAECGVHLDADDAVGRFEFETGEFITEELAKTKPVWEVQSIVTGCGPITRGECGVDPSTKEITKLNTPIGVISGQTQGESSTQLSLRSKHRSGAVDISESSENKIVILESGVVTDRSVIGDFISITVETESGDQHQYMHHNNRDALKGTLHEVPVRTHILLDLRAGDKVTEGDVVAVYSESLQGADISGTLQQVIKLMGASNPGKSFTYPRSITAPRSGVLSYKIVTPNRTDSSTGFVIDGKWEPIDLSHVEVMIDGELVAIHTQMSAMLLPAGTSVSIGEQLTFGLPDVIAFWGQTGDIQATWWVFYQGLKKLYNGRFSPIHFEVTFRSMMDLHESKDEYGEINKTRDEVDSLDGVQMTGVGRAPVVYPSFLRSFGYGYIRSRLNKAMVNREVTKGTPTEVLMSGGLIPSPRKSLQPAYNPRLNSHHPDAQVR